MRDVPQSPTAPSARGGIAFGAGAYGLWGLLPLYIAILVPAGAFEVIAHRVVWSLLFCVAALALIGGLGRYLALLRNPALLRRLALAAALVSVNWSVFVIAALAGFLVDVALGYFLNPILTSLLAVAVLKERLRPAQWASLALSAAAFVVIAIGYGTVPWVALTVATTFALYGLIKKQVGPSVGAMEGMAVETTVLSPFALAYLGYLAWAGSATFATAGVENTVLGSGPIVHSLLLMGAGPATAIPLIMFSAASRRLPLATMASLQYIAPILQFVIGVAVLGEAMPIARWIGFALVWVALVILTVDGMRRSMPHRQERPRN